MHKNAFFVLLLLSVLVTPAWPRQTVLKSASLAHYWAKRFKNSSDFKQLNQALHRFEKQNAADLQKESLPDSVLSLLLEVYRAYQNSIYPVMEREFKSLDEKESQRAFKKIYKNAMQERDTVFVKMARLCNGRPQNKPSLPLCQNIKKYFAEIRFQKDFKSKPAPDFSFTDLKGREYKLSAFRKRYVLLHFWSMHSIPCVQELGDLKKVYRKYGAKDLEIISINTDPVNSAWDREILTNFIRQMKMNWIQIADGKNKRIFNLYHIHNYPTLFLLDKKGRAVNPDFRLGKALRGKQLFKTLKKVLGE